MSDNDIQRLVSVLEEIRDNQRIQLERQSESLSMQREQYAIVHSQHERAQRIQDRAEAIQEKGAQLVAGSRKALVAVLPMLIVLVIYLSWLIFRS